MLGASTPRAARSRLGRAQAWAGFAFAVPAMLLFAAFAAWPVIATFGLSVTDFNFLNRLGYIGAYNYRSLAGDALFLNSLRATFVYVGGVFPLVWILALLVAVGLNRSSRLLGAFRVTYFLPVVMAMVVASVVWTVLYHPFGLINQGLRLIWPQPPMWLTSSDWAPVALIFMGIWKHLGYFVVIFLAGLQAIPQEYYAAAQVDGAGTWAQFRHITLPRLRPVMLLVVVIGLITGFQEFTPQYVMTGGGPVDATRVLALFIYQTAFVFQRMGRAAAASVILFAIIFAITIVQRRLLRERD